jgi:hypothetical protein
MAESTGRRPSGRSARIGLAVVFAALAADEREAIDRAWCAGAGVAHNWNPAFVRTGVAPITNAAPADLLVYLGESSRFDSVAGALAQKMPVVFVKSTVEQLLEVPPGAPRRYRMCTGVRGIARALASVAPPGPTVDWTRVPWPEGFSRLCHLDDAEQRYVDVSVAAFREAMASRSIPWRTVVPPDGSSFSVFLTMHDPAAATLAAGALGTWARCTVLAADGMVAMRAPNGDPWSDRLIRVRHWSPRIRSASNGLFRAALDGRPLPDFDSAGMLFGTMAFLDRALATGARPHRLEDAGAQWGPVGLTRLTASGCPHPERLVVFQGQDHKVIAIESATDP